MFCKRLFSKDILSAPYVLIIIIDDLILGYVLQLFLAITITYHSWNAVWVKQLSEWTIESSIQTCLYLMVLLWTSSDIERRARREGVLKGRWKLVVLSREGHCGYPHVELLAWKAGGTLPSFLIPRSRLSKPTTTSTCTHNKKTNIKKQLNLLEQIILRVRDIRCSVLFPFADFVNEVHVDCYTKVTITVIWIWS